MSNEHLNEIAADLDLAGRLQQLFLDADDLLSDINSSLSFSLLELEPQVGEADKKKVEQTISVLRMARNKVTNIVHDFKVHYVMTADDQQKAGVDQLILAANNYKRG